MPARMQAIVHCLLGIFKHYYFAIIIIIIIMMHWFNLKCIHVNIIVDRCMCVPVQAGFYWVNWSPSGCSLIQLLSIAGCIENIHICLIVNYPGPKLCLSKPHISALCSTAWRTAGTAAFWQGLFRLTVTVNQAFRFAQLQHGTFQNDRCMFEDKMDSLPFWAVLKK